MELRSGLDCGGCDEMKFCGGGEANGNVERRLTMRESLSG